MWSALPLLALKPPKPLIGPSWLSENVFGSADAFLYKNSVSAEKLLNVARLWSLATWAALLSVCVFVWSRRLGGSAQMMAVAPFLALCPPLISNFALVSTDSAATALYFATFYTLSKNPRREAHYALAGVTMGLAMTSAYGMVLLPPCALIALLVESRLAGGKPLQARHVLILLASALAIVSVIYGPSGFMAYWRDLASTLAIVSTGWPSYLMGSISQTGFLAYFLVAVAVKTPLPQLFAAALGAASMIERRPARECLWLLVPPVVYFAAACFSKTQAGLRYVLLIFPFMVVCAGEGLAWLWTKPQIGKPAACLLLAWLAASVFRVHPHYLAYFNEAAGGPTRGQRLLVDSNLDWGQGLRDLALEIKRRGDPPIYLSYFGSGDPSYYGLRYYPLEFVMSIARREGVVRPGARDPVLLAVSATNLQGLYLDDPDAFAWLRDRKPAYRAGYSIFLYDLTNDAEGRAYLAKQLAAAK